MINFVDDVIAVRKVVDEHFNTRDADGKMQISLTLKEIIEFAEIAYKTGRIDYIEKLYYQLREEKWQGVIQRNPERASTKY